MFPQTFRSIGRLLLLLQGSFAAFLSSPVFGQSNNATIAYQSDTVIALETHGCFGTCPVYAIQIGSSGKAVTVGIQFTPGKGPFTVQISREKMTALSRAFAEANFCHLQDRYTSKGNSHITDIPGAYLSFRCGETLKCVYDYYGTPAIVRDLERQVQQAAQLESFLFSDRQTIERKFANGLNPDSQEAQELLSGAVQWKDQSLVQYLLERGVDPETPLSKTTYRGPLREAVLTNQVAISRLLVNHGADVRATKTGGKMRLLVEAARSQGSAEMLSALIDFGLDVNGSDASGPTPLMYAATRLRPDLVRVLLKAGANKSLRDQEGLTALDLAQRTRVCGSNGGLNTVALEDDPDHQFCDRPQTIALLAVEAK